MTANPGWQGTRTGWWRSPANWLLGIVAVLMACDLYLIFAVAPTEAVMGDVQRIFYVHVPLAIMSFLAFAVVFVASIVYLARRGEHWDRVAHASAEVGLVFVSLALITGIIWARPVWGVWWTWDPRLTTTLILWLIYAAYLMIRSYAPNRSRGAVYGAVVGIVGFVDVPIVYFSVNWWRSLHPEAVVGPLAETGSLEPIMTNILMFSFLTFLVLFLYLVVERTALRRAEDRAAALRYTRLSSEA